VTGTCMVGTPGRPSWRVCLFSEAKLVLCVLFSGPSFLSQLGGEAELSPQRGELEGGENVCPELFPNTVLPPTTNIPII
jgi:hypothetical protein